jgi:hypothetical protein
MPVMTAVANAVYDAVGVRIDEVPITPEKILKALEARAAGRPPRYGPSRFPEIAWPEPLHVAPPWEGGDGRAAEEGKGQQDKRQRAKGEGPQDKGQRAKGEGQTAEVRS